MENLAAEAVINFRTAFLVRKQYRVYHAKIGTIDTLLCRVCHLILIYYRDKEHKHADSLLFVPNKSFSLLMINDDFWPKSGMQLVSRKKFQHGAFFEPYCVKRGAKRLKFLFGMHIAQILKNTQRAKDLLQRRVAACLMRCTNGGYYYFCRLNKSYFLPFFPSVIFGQTTLQKKCQSLQLLDWWWQV